MTSTEWHTHVHQLAAFSENSDINSRNTEERDLRSAHVNRCVTVICPVVDQHTHHSFQLRSHTVHCIAWALCHKLFLPLCSCLCKDPVAFHTLFCLSLGQSDVLHWQQRQRHKNNWLVSITLGSQSFTYRKSGWFNPCPLSQRVNVAPRWETLTISRFCFIL